MVISSTLSCALSAFSTTVDLEPISSRQVDEQVEMVPQHLLR